MNASGDDLCWVGRGFELLTRHTLSGAQASNSPCIPALVPSRVAVKTADSESGLRLALAENVAPQLLVVDLAV